MTGKDKFAAVGEKLHADENQKKDEELKPMEATEQQLAETEKKVLASRKVLEEMKKADAAKQTEEEGGLQPWLKVFDSARSTYTLRDGSTPHHGFLFYQPEEIEMEEAYVHILTISRGFRAEGMKDSSGKMKYPYQQIVSGVLIDEMKLKPFWLTIAGAARLQKLWEFRAEFNKKARGGLSKFSLVIHVKVERLIVKNPEGKDTVSQVIAFNFVPDENGNPQETEDMDTYLFLKEKREQEKKHIEDYISRKEVFTDSVKPVQATITGPGIKQEGDTITLDPNAQDPGPGDADGIPF